MLQFFIDFKGWKVKDPGYSQPLAHVTLRYTSQSGFPEGTASSQVGNLTSSLLDLQTTSKMEKI